MGRRKRKTIIESNKVKKRLEKKILGDKDYKEFIEVFYKLYHKRHVLTKKYLREFIETTKEKLQKNALKKPKLVSKWSYNIEKITNDVLKNNYYCSENIVDIFDLYEKKLENYKNLNTDAKNKKKNSKIIKSLRNILTAGLMLYLAGTSVYGAFLTNTDKNVLKNNFTNKKIEKTLDDILFKKTDSSNKKTFSRNKEKKNKKTKVQARRLHQW